MRQNGEDWSEAEIDTQEKTEEEEQEENNI